MSSSKDLLVRKVRTYTGQDLKVLVSGSQGDEIYKIVRRYCK